MQKKFLMYLLLFGILLKFSTAKVTALSQNENTLVPIESTKISEIVTTYKVDNGNYFISEFNLNDCSPGDEIILYNENDTEVKIAISNNQETSALSPRYSYSNDSGWSGGYIPFGTTTLHPSFNTNDIYVSYDVDANGTDMTLSSPYNGRISIVNGRPEYLNLLGLTLRASDSTPAHVRGEFKGNNFAYNIEGYLSLQLNSIGQVRVFWAYDMV